MPQNVKLYQILEKAHIETKIAVEIQDWIVDTMEEKRIDSMVQFEETKLLPMHLELRTKLDGLDLELRTRMDHLETKLNSRIDGLELKMRTGFASLEKEMRAGFQAMDKKYEAVVSFNRILAVPIVGSTVGGLGFLFLQIYERVMGG
jgi:hypothetical protein